MKYRLIIMENSVKNSELVRFCDAKDDSPATDFYKIGFPFVTDPNVIVNFDGIIEADLPKGFPANHTFARYGATNGQIIID